MKVDQEFDLPDRMPAEEAHHNDKAQDASGMPDCVRHHSCKISPFDDATATSAMRVAAGGVEPHDATLR